MPTRPSRIDNMSPNMAATAGLIMPTGQSSGIARQSLQNLSDATVMPEPRMGVVKQGSSQDLLKVIRRMSDLSKTKNPNPAQLNKPLENVAPGLGAEVATMLKAGVSPAMAYGSLIGAGIVAGTAIKMADIKTRKEMDELNKGIEVGARLNLTSDTIRSTKDPRRAAERIQRATTIRPNNNDKFNLREFFGVNKAKAQQPPPGDNPFEFSSNDHVSKAKLLSGGWTREEQLDYYWNQMPDATKQNFIDKYGNGDEQQGKDYWAKFVVEPNQWSFYNPNYLVKFSQKNIDDPEFVDSYVNHTIKPMAELFELDTNTFTGDTNDAFAWYLWLNNQLFLKSEASQGSSTPQSMTSSLQPAGGSELQQTGTPTGPSTSSGSFLQGS